MTSPVSSPLAMFCSSSSEVMVVIQPEWPVRVAHGLFKRIEGSGEKSKSHILSCRSNPPDMRSSPMLLIGDDGDLSTAC